MVEARPIRLSSPGDGSRDLPSPLRRHRTGLAVSGLIALAISGVACRSHIAVRDARGRLLKEGEVALSPGGERIQHGPWTYYWPNGAKKSEGEFVEDLPDGEVTYWYESGEIEMRGSFADGMRSGEWTYWYPNGGVRARGSFVEGREHGEWVFHREDGSVEDRSLFAHGRRRSLAAPGEAGSSAAGSSADDATEVANAGSADVAGADAELPTVPVRPQADWTLAEAARMPALLARFGLEPPAEDVGLSSAWDAPGKTTNEPSPPESVDSALVGRRLPKTRFRDTEGRIADLADLRGRLVVIVVLRGYTGGVCVYCAAQTAALQDDAAFARFRELDAELLVVYPGPSGSVAAFLDLYDQTFHLGPPPYRILYDEDLVLVRGLDVEDQLAKPATLILDRNGEIAWAYVGEGMADRPSTKRILEELERVAMREAGPS